MEDVDESVAECTAVATLDAAAELRLHRLLPVTDAEQRDARIEDRLRDARATLVDHRRGAAREDDATGSHPFEGFLGRVERRDLAVDAGLADAAGDELGDLTAEIDDQDAVMGLRGPARAA